ncbi:lysophospholipid acyltransferase family protein [Candidatus Phytoplasma solani]|uniref:1-acyl-sn-glycerol-3-phosphate acyltransferase n=2 Tax=Candidatus Phytoplasma solani TaxID=69896 RepID=A0A421NXM4_9MOLU|nr:lysophospholipid acyltransferase family protein [Candidatus Phytoplasma solani]RMI88738.1 1-acyl-sn-glycerol-3-phosphate acyltransferase [Candidatus Phytoplasma solani]
MFTFIFIATFLLSTFMLCHIMSFWFFPIALFFALFLTFITLFLVLLLCLAIMSFLPSNHKFKGFVAQSLALLVKRFLRIKITVTNPHLLPLSKNIVIYANHKSYTDPFIIASVIPRTIAFSPKDKFRSFCGSHFFLQLAFYAFDYMVISRDNIRKTALSLIKAIPKVKAGLAMVVFPEGGIKDRNDEATVPLLEGSFKIAFKTQADIIPLTIKGSSRIKNYYWWQKKTVEVIIHQPLKYKNYHNQTMSQIALTVQKQINSSFA